MITIDGSMGEGGGQVLRTALTMALATGRPCRIDNIRGGRPKPGLLRQHLTAVTAAAAISDARVEGATIGSRTLTFYPGVVKGGDYAFAVGTAGSATLVLQTVLAPLLLTSRPSTVTLEGGTHNPWAPPFDFLDRVVLPLVNRTGPNVRAVLNRPGFYPAGGGLFTVTVQPRAAMARLDLLERGEIRGRRVKVMLANLPKHIAERELMTTLRFLNWPDECGSIEEVSDGSGPGNVLIVEVEAEHATQICTGFGEMRHPRRERGGEGGEGFEAISRRWCTGGNASRRSTDAAARPWRRRIVSNAGADASCLDECGCHPAVRRDRHRGA